MNAMILAAGRGNRLRPITDTLPKALVEVRGKSLLERHLDALRAAGIENVVINLDWLGEMISERIGNGSMYGLNVAYSDEAGDVLETGGGIFNALPLLGDDPFLVVNADIYTDMPMPQPRLDEGMMGHLVLVPTPLYKAVGDFDLADDKVRTSTNPTLTFSGVAVYRPAFFAGCRPGRFPLAPMLKTAADAGQLSGSVYTGRWEDVGTVERLADLNRE